MEFDDRPDYAKRLEAARIARGFRFAKEAASYFGWKYETYIQHEQGIRGISRAAGRYAKAFRVSEGWLLTGEGRGPNSATLTPEGQLRAAILNFGVHPDEVGRAVSAVRLFLDDDDGQSSQDPLDDQSEPATRRHAKEPSN